MNQMNSVGPIDLKWRKEDEPFHVESQAMNFEILAIVFFGCREQYGPWDTRGTPIY